MRCFVPFPLLQEKETISIFRFVYMKTCGKSKLKEKGEMNMSQKMPELIISTASKSITVKGPLPGVSNTKALSPKSGNSGPNPAPIRWEG